MSQISEQTRQALLQQHGGFALAYSAAFQPDLLRFGDERGFLAYLMVGRTAFALADPVAPQELHGALIDAFIAEKKDAAFCQASRRTAQLLAERGFFVNEFGCLTELDLASFSFAGPKRRSFRTAANRLAASGGEIREAPVGSLDPDRVRLISDAWRRTRVTKGHELRFLVRPAVLGDEPGVRKFFLFDAKGQPEAFAFFDPVYKNGAVTGYLSATRRWLPGADPLAAYALIRAAIERFQAEGVRTLHLGLSPFHLIEDAEFNKRWVVRRAFRFLYTNGMTNRFLYSFRTLARHKENYGGSVRQSYFAFNTLPALPRLLKLLWACSVI